MVQRILVMLCFVGMMAVVSDYCAAAQRKSSSASSTTSTTTSTRPGRKTSTSTSTSTTTTTTDSMASTTTGTTTSGTTTSTDTTTTDATTTATTATVVPTTANVLVSWDAPTLRTDGTALDTSELASFDIYYFDDLTGAIQTIHVADPSLRQWRVPSLSKSTTYHFSIITTDVTGVASAASDIASIAL